MAARSVRERPVFGVTSNSHSGSRFSTLIVGGTKSSSSALTVKTASSAAEAPRRCPVMDFVELIESLRAASSPRESLSAFTSLRSPVGVEVPCALT